MNTRTFKASDAHRLDDPERLKWLPPDEAIQMLSLEPGMTVADIGAGTGYFSLPFARAIAPEGRVLAWTFSRRCWRSSEGSSNHRGRPLTSSYRGAPPGRRALQLDVAILCF